MERQYHGARQVFETGLSLFLGYAAKCAGRWLGGLCGQWRVGLRRPCSWAGAAVVPARDLVHHTRPGGEPGAVAFVVVELGFEVREEVLGDCADAPIVVNRRSCWGCVRGLADEAADDVAFGFPFRRFCARRR